MPQQQPDPILSIIIISYNTAQLTTQAIQAVIDDLASNKTLQAQSKIIVVDNNSKDESVAKIKELQTANETRIELILNKENLGFAKANNQGINKSKGEFVLLLNSDTQIKKGALKQLVKSFQEHPLEPSTAFLSSSKDKLDHLGILAATLLNQDNSHQPQGGSLPTLLSLAIMMFFIDDIPILGQLLPTVQETGRAARHKQFLQHQITQKLYQKGWVAGTAMAIRREVINDIGLLDENIFMYGEDIEYCLRAKKKHWDIAIDPQAEVTHLGSASSSSAKAVVGEIKSYLYIWAKHKPHWQRRFAKMILYWGIILRIFIFKFIVKDEDRVKAYQEAENLLH